MVKDYRNQATTMYALKTIAFIIWPKVSERDHISHPQNASYAEILPSCERGDFGFSEPCQAVRLKLEDAKRPCF